MTKMFYRHSSVTQIRTHCYSSAEESVDTELLWRVHLNTGDMNLLK